MTDMSIKELTNEMVDFIKTENPNLLYLGFDRNIINKLAILYREKHLILNWILLPDAIYRKTERASDNIKEEIKKEINIYQKNNVRLYADNFEKWLHSNQISKKTKQNFKNFLKQNDIKMDEFLTTQIINYKNEAN